MRASLTIAWREIRSFAWSPFAYVVAALHLGVSGLLFVSNVTGLTQARLDDWMRDAAGLTLFLVPILSMRAIAEERRSGSLEHLLSAPVTDAAVVAGKYLGLLAFYTSLLVVTLVYPLLLSQWSDPALGPLVAGYVGLELLGAATLAVGVLASSFTRQQVVAAVLSFVLLLVLWQLRALGDAIGQREDTFSYFATSSHIEPFIQGVIRPKDVVYYTTIAFVGQFAAARVLATRRWL